MTQSTGCLLASFQSSHRHPEFRFEDLSEDVITTVPVKAGSVARFIFWTAVMELSSFIWWIIEAENSQCKKIMTKIKARYSAFMIQINILKCWLCTFLQTRDYFESLCFNFQRWVQVKLCNISLQHQHRNVRVWYYHIVGQALSQANKLKHIMLQMFCSKRGNFFVFHD